jgi:hypothetical protein
MVTVLSQGTGLMRISQTVIYHQPYPAGSIILVLGHTTVLVGTITTTAHRQDLQVLQVGVTITILLLSLLPLQLLRALPNNFKKS